MPDDSALVLDVTVLAECARGDAELIGMIQRFDAEHITLVVPALAVAGVIIDAGGTDDQAAVIRGICRLGGARFAGIALFDDAGELARVRLATTVEHLWDVQTAETAISRRAPILTLDRDRWEQTRREIGDLAVIEVANPG